MSDVAGQQDSELAQLAVIESRSRRRMGRHRNIMPRRTTDAAARGYLHQALASTDCWRVVGDGLERFGAQSSFLPTADGCCLPGVTGWVKGRAERGRAATL